MNSKHKKKILQVFEKKVHRNMNLYIFRMCVPIYRYMDFIFESLKDNCLLTEIMYSTELKVKIIRYTEKVFSKTQYSFMSFQNSSEQFNVEESYLIIINMSHYAYSQYGKKALYLRILARETNKRLQLGKEKVKSIPVWRYSIYRIAWKLHQKMLRIDEFSKISIQNQNNTSVVFFLHQKSTLRNKQSYLKYCKKKFSSKFILGYEIVLRWQLQNTNGSIWRRYTHKDLPCS